MKQEAYKEELMAKETAPSTTQEHIDLMERERQRNQKLGRDADPHAQTEDEDGNVQSDRRVAGAVVVNQRPGTDFVVDASVPGSGMGETKRSEGGLVSGQKVDTSVPEPGEQQGNTVYADRQLQPGEEVADTALVGGYRHTDELRADTIEDAAGNVSKIERLEDTGADKKTGLPATMSGRHAGGRAAKSTKAQGGDQGVEVETKEVKSQPSTEQKDKPVETGTKSDDEE